MKVNLGNAWLKLGASATTYFMAASAFASTSNDLGGLSTTLTTQIQTVPAVISTGAYVAAVGFGGSTLLNAKSYAENPNGQVKMGHIGGRAAACVGCAALPWFMNTALTTFGAGTGQGGTVQGFHGGL